MKPILALKVLALAALLGTAGLAAVSRPSPSGLGRLSGAVLTRCGPEDAQLCRVLADKTRRLNRRKPEAEAKAAAAAGDFRLGAVLAIGPTPEGWDTAGVDCETWSRDLIGKWHVFDDYVLPEEARHTEAAERFIARYNRALVSDGRFPYRDICAPEGRKPDPAYAGPVTTFAQAARSRDLAKVRALARAGGAEVDAVDPFGRTALAYALYNNDPAIAEALLDLGAKPAAAAEREPSMAAVALRRGQIALARRLLAAGAPQPPVTGLCEEGPMYIDLAAPSEPARNGGCTWPGLLLQTRQYDLFDRYVRSPEAEELGDWSEVSAEFVRALRARDAALAARLLPALDRPRRQTFFEWSDEIFNAGLFDVLRAYLLEQGGLGAARSGAEASLWRAAAENGRWPAFALLFDYGAELNHLSRARLEACRADAARGDEAALFGCVKEAQARAEAFKRLAAAGDLPALRARLADMSDLKEGRKTSVVDIVARDGAPEMLAAVLAAGAPPSTPRRAVLTTDAKGDLVPERIPPIYKGALAAEAARWAAEARYADTLYADDYPDPLQSLSERGDVAKLRVLSGAGLPWLANHASSLIERIREPSMSFSDEPEDAEKLPDAPPERLSTVLRVLSQAVARREGPQALEPVFRSAVQKGWNTTLRELMALGFNPARAKEPGRIWDQWRDFSSACKPSTARLLASSGLPRDFRSFGDDKPWPILKSVVATCRDPRSVAALVAAGVAEVNALDEQGETALDEAQSRKKPAMVAALRALGGRTGAEIRPKQTAARQRARRLSDDLDLEQSDAQ